MVVMVKRGDVTYPCKSEEQLNKFLAAGYVKVEEKATTKKTVKK